MTTLKFTQKGVLIREKTFSGSNEAEKYLLKQAKNKITDKELLNSAIADIKVYGMLKMDGFTAIIY